MQIHFSPNAFTAADIGPVRSNPGGSSGPFAIMPFGPFDFFITEPETAKQLLAVAAEALRILAPDTDPVADLVADLLGGSDVQPDPYIDAMAAEHVREYEPGAAQPEDIPVLLDRATGCPECGAVGLPRREDGTCWNAAGCRERQAAKAGAR